MPIGRNKSGCWAYRAYRAYHYDKKKLEITGSQYSVFEKVQKSQKSGFFCISKMAIEPDIFQCRFGKIQIPIEFENFLFVSIP